MKNSPNMYNGRYFTAVYLDVPTFEQIEELRGKQSRNGFINELIERGLNQN